MTLGLILSLVKYNSNVKRKKECTIQILFSGSQLWRLDNRNQLQNKNGLWWSKEKWNFKTKDDLIYIENISKTKVLEATNDGEVILEDFEEGKAEQLWKKGVPDAEGYFTIENYYVLPKFMTAISESGLKIKGNISLRRIPS